MNEVFQEPFQHISPGSSLTNVQVYEGTYIDNSMTAVICTLSNKVFQA